MIKKEKRQSLSKDTTFRNKNDTSNTNRKGRNRQKQGKIEVKKQHLQIIAKQMRSLMQQKFSIRPTYLNKLFSVHRLKSFIPGLLASFDMTQ